MTQYQDLADGKAHAAFHQEGRVRSGRLSLLLWLPPLLFLGFFFLYPLLRILGLGLAPVSSTNNIPVPYAHIANIFVFTFHQAFLSTILTLLVGLPAAFLFASYEFRGKSFLRTLTAIPFMLPTVVVASAFSAFLGQRGWANLALMRLLGTNNPPINFYGTFGAILLAHVFYNTTIIIRIVGNALVRRDLSLEQAAKSLGASPKQVFWRITMALLRPSIFAASLLVFIFDFTSFGVILLVGGPNFSTLEVEIYRQVTSFFNLPLAALLSMIQLLCTLVFSIIYSRIVTRTTVRLNPRINPTKRPRTSGQRFFVIAMSVIVLILFALPLSSLPIRSFARLEADEGQRGQVNYGLTGEYYAELFINRNESVFYVPPFQAIANSLIYATATVILSLLLGIPAAIALSRPGGLQRILDPFFLLPLGASAVTLGLGLIVTYNHPLFGSAVPLVATPMIVPIAHTIIALPFIIRTLQPAIVSVPDRLRQAASILGAPPLRVWLTVDWPILSRAIISAAVFAFTISLGEFGASSLVVRPDYPTLPIAIARFLSLPGGLNYGQAMAMATILMVVCGLGILGIEHFRLPGVAEF